VVVDVTNSPSWEDAAVLKFFETSTRNQLTSGSSRGRRTSCCVVSRRNGTSARKRILPRKNGSGEPDQGFLSSLTIIRATQFFESSKGIADFSTEGNKVRLPTALIQPMAADDVASEVGRIAPGAPVMTSLK
jgi:hypothetical protein